jgi:tetratricopeptide (TPR) repeat protein
MLTIKNADEVEGWVRSKEGEIRERSAAMSKAPAAAKSTGHPPLNAPSHWLANHPLRLVFQTQPRSSSALRALFFALPFLCLTLTGCRPPGPRALLDGQRLIERGRYADAIARLKTATSLMSTNAQAWNYLGLACHEDGQLNDAAEAYRKALALDQNLVEVHYNLGCLWLEQNRPDLAKGELTAYTLRREKSPEGWVKLGEAQMDLHDLTGAERSLNQARLIDANNPDALNDLGVVQMQRNRTTEAAQFFNAALRAKPDYAPAILNLAIASQQLNNRQYALQRYQDYLSLKPPPTNSEAVEAVVRALEQEISPSAAVSRPAATPSNVPSAASVARSANTATRTNTTVRARPEPSTKSNPRSAPSGNAPVEVTQVAPEPVIRGAPESASGSEPVVSSNSTARSERHGFFSHVNPANLFRGSKTEQTSSPTQAAVAPEPRPVSYPRYSYRSPRKPAEGDRTAAQKAFVEGAQAQQARQLPEAVTAYRRAIQSDPAYFDAYYNLGVVSVQAGNLPLALWAYEMALAIEPDSHDARFNFALALKQANYPIDAANELEKVLAKSPGDVYAHYALGALYAVQLREPAKAREHYQKVLELNPAFPQASAIHDWLWANPR